MHDLIELSGDYLVQGGDPGANGSFKVLLDDHRAIKNLLYKLADKVLSPRSLGVAARDPTFRNDRVEQIAFFLYFFGKRELGSGLPALLNHFSPP